MSNAIQLIGIDKVLDVFSDFDQEGYAWALFQGRDPIVTGEGSADLEKWLQRFEPAGSTGTYILKIYRNSDPDKIDRGTPYSAAFNFKLQDNYGGQGIAGTNNQLWQRLAALEQRYQDDDKDDDKSVTDSLIGWLDEPEKLNQVMGAVSQLIAAIKGGQPVAAVGGFGVADPANGEDKLTTLARTLDELEKHDSALVTHLQKLLKLAETNPVTFKIVLTQLDGL